VKKRRGVGGEEERREEGEEAEEDEEGEGRKEVDESRELWRWRRFESINMKDSSMGFRVFAGGEGSVSGGRGGKTG
jgi:hypothetical protein